MPSRKAVASHQMAAPNTRISGSGPGGGVGVGTDSGAKYVGRTTDSIHTRSVLDNALIEPSPANSVVIAGRTRRNARATARAAPVLRTARTSPSKTTVPPNRLIAEPAAST